MDHPVCSQALLNINQNPIKLPKPNLSKPLSMDIFQVFFVMFKVFINYVTTTLLYKLEWEKNLETALLF